jgi:hypothetical protein
MAKEYGVSGFEHPIALRVHSYSIDKSPGTTEGMWGYPLLRGAIKLYYSRNATVKTELGVALIEHFLVVGPLFHLCGKDCSLKDLECLHPILMADIALYRLKKAVSRLHTAVTM